MTLKSLFEEDFLITGISVIVLCIIEVNLVVTPFKWDIKMTEVK